LFGVRTERLELDEAWSFVGKKQKSVQRHEIPAKGDQYISSGWPKRRRQSLAGGVGRRFNRLTNGFQRSWTTTLQRSRSTSPHYNLCCTHEALRTTPAKAPVVADRG
jgi:hypothetical protein